MKGLLCGSEPFSSATPTSVTPQPEGRRHMSTRSSRPWDHRQCHLELDQHPAGGVNVGKAEIPSLTIPLEPWRLSRTTDVSWVNDKARITLSYELNNALFHDIAQVVD